MKILAVCPMGFGSGMVLKMTLERVLKDLGVKADIGIADIGIWLSSLPSWESSMQLAAIRATNSVEDVLGSVRLAASAQAGLQS